METNSSILTVEEVAEFLKISRSMTYTLVRQGVIPSIHVGRCVRVPESLMFEYLQRNTLNLYQVK